MASLYCFSRVAMLFRGGCDRNVPVLSVSIRAFGSKQTASQSKSTLQADGPGIRINEIFSDTPPHTNLILLLFCSSKAGSRSRTGSIVVFPIAESQVELHSMAGHPGLIEKAT